MIAAYIFGSLLVAASAANAVVQIRQLRRRARKRRHAVPVWRILAFDTAGSAFPIALALLLFGIYLLLSAGQSVRGIARYSHAAQSWCRRSAEMVTPASPARMNKSTDAGHAHASGPCRPARSANTCSPS
jgi:hypothetical protein